MSTSDIGTTIEIASGVPATIDAAGYAALTYVKAEGLVSVGSIGDSHASINVPDLETGRTGTKKGAVTGTATPVVFRDILVAGTRDQGQTNFKEAAKSRDEYSFKVTDPDGAIDYVSGVVMNHNRNERTDSSYAGFSVDITNNYEPVEVAAP